MLFLCILAEMGGAEGVGLSFAHSSLILRLSFAQGSNRNFFCWGIDKDFVRLTYESNFC